MQGLRAIKLSSNRLILIAIIALSVSLRLGAAVFMGDEVRELPGTYDQISYHKLAIRVLEGQGFSFSEKWWPITQAGEPTAHWSFLYTLYLVAVYAIFGVHPLAARIIQAMIVGVMHPMLAYWIGRRVFSGTVGLIVGAISAVYIYFVYYSAALMTEAFFITTTLASLFVASQLLDASNDLKSVRIRRNEIKHALVFGFLIGLSVLLRQLILLLIPFFVLVFIAKRRMTGVVLTGLLTIPLIILVIPFTVYNFTRFDRFVLLNTNAGFAFFWANHPIYGTRFEPILSEDMGSYQELIPEELRDLDEASLDQALLRRGIQFVLADPGRYLKLSISRFPPYFKFWPSPDSSLISNISRVGSYAIFLPFMIGGICYYYFLGRKKYSHSRSGANLLIFFCILYSGIHLLSWTLIRYRLPVDAVMTVFAGLFISIVLNKLQILTLQTSQ
jgi:4-amino-4-deoxy-L-arabinose transferase-like glycosyltransferase